MKEEDIYKELISIRDNNIGELDIQDWKHEYLEKYVTYCESRIINNKEVGHNFVGISEEGKYFIDNYDNSLSKKIDKYLGKYPNISKLFYFLIGIVVGLIPTVTLFFTNFLGKN